jgi:hypothetical protein
MPAGCKIDTATLSLYANAPISGRTYQVFQVTSNSANSWTETGVTWSNQPSTTGTPATLSLSGTQSGYRDWNVSAIVQAIYSSGTNNGFLIQDASEGANGNGVQQLFVSKESATNQPQLVITYTQAP